MMDKFMAVAGFIVLTLDLGYLNRIPLYLTTLVITRDVLILTISIAWATATGRTRFPATWLGKVHSTVLVVTLCLYLLHNALQVTTFMLWVAVVASLVTTISTGMGYALRTVRIIQRPPPEGSAEPEEPRGEA
jgi:phosphatidylglycerophosphate synthase